LSRGVRGLKHNEENEGKIHREETNGETLRERSLGLPSKRFVITKTSSKNLKGARGLTGGGEERVVYGPEQNPATSRTFYSSTNTKKKVDGSSNDLQNQGKEEGRRGPWGGEPGGLQEHATKTKGKSAPTSYNNWSGLTNAFLEHISSPLKFQGHASTRPTDTGSRSTERPAVDTGDVWGGRSGRAATFQVKRNVKKVARG